MSLCPKCGNQIEEPFGIVQCSSCKVMLVADFEGNLKVSSEDVPFETPAQSLPEAPFQPSTAIQDPEQEPAQEWNFQESPETPSQPPEEISKIEVAPHSVVQEISDFANSEISSAKEGVLYYTLEISGIDSSDLKQAVQDCLTDSRLGLNVSALMKSIDNGSLKISNLNAIKASIIVTRLKEFPMDINWQQMSIFNSGVKSEPIL